MVHVVWFFQVAWVNLTYLRNYHSWASASRSMLPASTFRHPVSQSGTGVFRYRRMPVPDWFRHPHFCSFRYWPDWMPDSPLFKKVVHPARPYCWLGKWIHPARPYCCWWKGIYPARPSSAGDGVILAIWYWKSYVNAGMPECRTLSLLSKLLYLFK